MKNSYQIVSFNVNGIRAAAKKGLADFISTYNADIFCLQEIKALESQLDEELLAIDNFTPYFHSAEKKGYSGVAFYTKAPPLEVTNGLGVEEFDREGRVIIAEYEQFFLLNCYFPNSQNELKRIDYRLAFGEALLNKLNSLSHKTRIICGDFNVSHKAIDLKNPAANVKNAGYSLPERQWMDKFIETGYTDTFRIFNQQPDQYTWWSYRANARARNVGWRLDYFCVDSSSSQKVKESIILKDILGSDHCPVAMGIDFQQ